MKLYYLPRTAIEAEILFAARIMQVRFLKRLSGKTPLEQNSSGKKIGAESAVLHFVFFIVIVNKMQQSAKRIRSNKNILFEVFPLTAILAGSGKTKPFEKRRSRYKETAENKAEAYRVYVEHLFSAYDTADARIFVKDAKKIILNAGAFEQTDNHELQGFLRYVKTGELTTDYTKRIESMIQTVKMSEQARQEYRFKSAVIMDAEDRGLERGLAEGSRQAKFETARLMKAETLASDLIAKVTGLSKEEIEAIQ